MFNSCRYIGSPNCTLMLYPICYRFFIHIQGCIQQICCGFLLKSNHFIPFIAFHRIVLIHVWFPIWNKNLLPVLIVSQISQVDQIRQYIIPVGEAYGIILERCHIPSTAAPDIISIIAARSPSKFMLISGTIASSCRYWTSSFYIFHSASGWQRLLDYIPDTLPENIHHTIISPAHRSVRTCHINHALPLL